MKNRRFLARFGPRPPSIVIEEAEQMRPGRQSCRSTEAAWSWPACVGGAKVVSVGFDHAPRGWASTPWAASTIPVRTRRQTSWDCTGPLPDSDPPGALWTPAGEACRQGAPPQSDRRAPARTMPGFGPLAALKPAAGKPPLASYAQLPRPPPAPKASKPGCGRTGRKAAA